PHTLHTLSLYCHGAHPDPHSFPTRRSSDLVKQAKHSMDKAVEAVKREFSTVRTGKATTSLLDLVRVDAYGSEMPQASTRTRSSRDRKSTRLNSSHVSISYAVFCLKKKNKTT